MSRLAVPTYDLTYEIDGDGDLGSVMSLDVHGHLDFAEQELVMAQIVEEEFAEEGFYLEVEHLWRKEYPREDFEEMGRWEYGYTSYSTEGAVAVTRFQVASYWSHLCVNHPDELATTGMPVSQIVEEQQHLAENGYVYMCAPCAESFSKRREAAIKAALRDQAA